LVGKAHRQRAGDVKGGSFGAVLDLMAAGGAVGDHERIRTGGGARRAATIFRPSRSRCRRCRCHSRNAPAMPQQLEFDGLDFKVRMSRSACFHRLERAKGLLVAIGRWTTAFSAIGFSGSERRPSAASRTRNSSNIRAFALTDFAVSSERSDSNSSAQRQQATWLEADDRHCRARKRCIGLKPVDQVRRGRDRRGRLKGTCVRNRADGRRPRASERAPRLFRPRSELQGSVEIFALIIAIEGIAKQNGPRGHRPGPNTSASGANTSRRHSGSARLGADPGDTLEQSAQELALVAQGWQAGRGARTAAQ